MNSETFTTVALVVGVMLLIGFFASWHAARSEAILKRWAEENGFLILACERRWLMRGPFFWTTSKSQDVYYVTVQDRNGRRRSGYVRCGSFLAGILSNRAEVRWED